MMVIVNKRPFFCKLKSNLLDIHECYMVRTTNDFQVVNENALLATFKGLNGGENAVKECLQVLSLSFFWLIYDYNSHLVIHHIGENGLFKLVNLDCSDS